jgi:hypothetical protein
MSAILSAQTGEDLVCIQRFTAWPKGEESVPKAGRTFRIGERVRYMGFYQDPKLKKNPDGWMVLFEAKGSKRPRRFAATQSHFVTAEGWERLRKFFARHFSAETRKRSLPTGKSSPGATKSNGHKKLPRKG